MLINPTELEQEGKRLAEQMNLHADAVQELIFQNAEWYRIRMSISFGTRGWPPGFKRPRPGMRTFRTDRQHGIRRQEFGQFIRAEKEMSETITDFSGELWDSMVDQATVHSKDSSVYTLKGRMEIKA